MSLRKADLAETATCPECGEISSYPENLIKEWNATPQGYRREGLIEIWIHYWECPVCGHRFRTATRIWPRERKVKQAKTMGKAKLDKIHKKLLQRQTQGTLC